MKFPVALQLYTLREEMEVDFVGTLEKVAEIGYQGVEFAGFGGMKAKDLKQLLDKLGLKAVASHTPLAILRDNFEETVNYNLEIENPYIIVPYAEYNGKEDYLNMAKELKEMGTALKEQGLQLGYHNHAHEFETFNGEYGLELIYKNTDPELLIAEIDTYWVKKAGLDPVSYLPRYEGRTPLIHLKDMEPETGDFAEVGEGIMQIEEIINQAEQIDVEWLIVEQDKCKRPALESVKISYNNLTEILK